MGKRKERRFAANNTSRRVKLDLFAEPSGDLGGSDVHDGVKSEQKELNNESPSSSGQKTGNPLLLLGQYSDDEMEGDSDEKAEDATANSSLANKTDQVDGHKDTNIKSSADTTMQMVDQHQTGKNSSASDLKAEGESGYVAVSNSVISDGLNKQTHSSVQTPGTVSLEQHAPTDVTSQWKMILHEESNQYYYWNTETGETSWEIPAVFTQTASAYGSGYNESGPIVTDASGLISGVEPSYLQPVQNIFTGTDCLGTNGQQVTCQMDSAVNYQPCQEELAGQRDSNAHANLAAGAATDLPSRLLSQSEGLLEKLRSLKKSHGNLHSNEKISKYIIEAEVRHSDVKALILDTSPLLSFWLHTEKQLKRLEEGVNDEIYELAKSAVMDEIAETNKSSPKEKLVADGNREIESEDSSREEGELAQSREEGELAQSREEGELAQSREEELAQAGEEGELAQSKEGELAQSEKRTLHSDESADVGGDVSPSHSRGHPAEQSDLTPSSEMLQKAGSPVVEDIDMDVDMDMEVEESVPTSSVKVIDASDGKMFSQTDPSYLHTDVPPPPSEEWIPPPPSEREDVPPPPPDSYSEPNPPPPLENGQILPALSSDSLGVSYTIPQSYMQQSADYAAQFNLSYPESSYQYIANGVALAPNTQFYSHIDGSQASLPQSTYYYESVPGTSEVAPAAASTIDAYYDFQGAAPLFPVISSAEASVLQSGVSSASYNIPSSSSATVEPSSRPSDSAVVASSGIASSQSTDITAGSSLLAKGQSKVKRPKKRTVAATSTLRSNKKVSSLVDKWKAAKEELNDSEEDEEEEDYGILDRKRRREIEEWKSRQIASGEAKDNANFQPLGGDWREKVKKKKQRAGREAVESEKKDEKQQKPDLPKLSADLPSGWQAYWDESTKKVYYGNTATSQTSWTRPKKT